MNPSYAPTWKALAWKLRWAIPISLLMWALIIWGAVAWGGGLLENPPVTIEGKNDGCYHIYHPEKIIIHIDGQEINLAEWMRKVVTIEGTDSRWEGILGADMDQHGCYPTAGYQWCESKQKCIRLWEEDCPKSNPEKEAP